jgi:hypothetical protein
MAEELVPKLPFNPSPPIMLDSGAFSAWTKKIDIDLNDYIDFALEHLDLVSAVVVLDSIPGSPGETKLSAAQVRGSAELTWKNFQTMLKAGIPREKLVPVFHQNEDDYFLDQMIAEAPYFGLSPANDRGTNEKLLFLDRCMKSCCGPDGMPKNKWHGFAATGIKMMVRYPWFSVDSASWRIFAAYGKIMIVISTSHPVIASVYRISDKATKDPDHLNNQPKMVQRLVEDLVESRGFTLDSLRSCAIMRSLWNATSYQDLQTIVPEWPWAYKHHKKGLGLV